MNVPLSPLRCLYRAVDLYGHKLGVVSGAERYSYQQFGELCARVAAGLIAIGVLPGDRVAFLTFNNTALLAGYFAVPMAGAVLMPLNVRLQQPEIFSIFEHSRPKVLFFESQFLPIIEVLRLSAVVSCRFIPIDGEYSIAGGGWNEFIQNRPLDRIDLFNIDENSPAELFYTSGSMGQPKGVLLSHRALYLHALSLAGTLDHGDDHVMLHTIPLFHANGWGFPHFATMCGMRHVMVRRFDPDMVLRLIQEEQATRMILVPTMAMMLVNFDGHAKFDLSSMREIMLGGAAASPQIIAALQRIFNAGIFTGYGLTESGPAASIARPKWSPKKRSAEEQLRYAASAGWPVLGMETRVVDGKMADVPHDGKTMGEIVVRGDSIMEGYYLDDEQTSAALANGWLHTGDMAVWDEDAWLTIVDRKKDIIISGGENISSIEVEQAICLHPSVLECAVVAAPHERWGEIPAAIVVVRDQHQLTEQQLIDFLLKRIARYKVPGIVCFHETPLPKTGTGKVTKQALRKPFWQD